MAAAASGTFTAASRKYLVSRSSATRAGSKLTVSSGRSGVASSWNCSSGRLSFASLVESTWGAQGFACGLGLSACVLLARKIRCRWSNKQRTISTQHNQSETP